jgi:hypothetical protein
MGLVFGFLSSGYLSNHVIVSEWQTQPTASCIVIATSGCNDGRTTQTEQQFEQSTQKCTHSLMEQVEVNDMREQH